MWPLSLFCHKLFAEITLRIALELELVYRPLRFAKSDLRRRLPLNSTRMLFQQAFPFYWSKPVIYHAESLLSIKHRTIHLASYWEIIKHDSIDCSSHCIIHFLRTMSFPSYQLSISFQLFNLDRTASIIGPSLFASVRFQIIGPPSQIRTWPTQVDIYMIGPLTDTSAASFTPLVPASPSS